MPKNQTTAGKSVERGTSGVRGKTNAARSSLHKGASGTRASKINAGKRV